MLFRVKQAIFLKIFIQNIGKGGAVCPTGNEKRRANGTAFAEILPKHLVKTFCNQMQKAYLPKELDRLFIKNIY